MNSPWLLLDVSYLAYRAYYAIGGKLSHNDIGTSVIYGILKELFSLQEIFHTKRVAWCFDHGKPKRCALLPQYKGTRHENKTDEEKEIVNEIRNQIERMRVDYLPSLGFRNVLFEKGFEADDIIAALIKLRPARSFVIVSNDQDLYQLLREGVVIWKPTAKEVYTEDHLAEEYGIQPLDWIDVKAYAGCDSDNVPGIDGVANKTAAKWLRGEITKGKIFDKFKANDALLKANRKLVTLPFPGISDIRLKKDNTSADKWLALIDRLGMNSLASYIPGIPRRSSIKLKRNTLR